MKIVFTCKYCARKSEEVSSSLAGKFNVIKLTCGHSYLQPIGVDVKRESDWSYTAANEGMGGVRKSLLPFQEKGLEIAAKSGFRVLLRFEMGLGKTPTTLAALAKYPEELLPVAIFCKSKLKAQWLQMMMEWCGEKYVPQIIDAGHEKPLKQFKVYIISLDMLRRLDWLDDPKSPINRVRTVVIDECQLIKNPTSKRTQAVQKFCKDKPHVIACSGTPIKNHSGEYYTILNIIRPAMFPSYADFLRHECKAEFFNGKFKIGGLRDPKRFHEKTQDFIVSFDREEVQPDLPKTFRTFHFCDMNDQYRKEYDEQLDLMEEEMSHEMTFERWGNVLAYMARMRHIAGRAKVPFIVDQVAEYLFENGKPLTLFVHHQDVGKMLFEEISKLCKEGDFNPPIALTSDMDKKLLHDYTYTSSETGWISRDPKDRIIIASTLAFGEGFNWQKCSTLYMCERQWNPANEKQAEDRFSRIGISKDVKQIIAKYFLAEGTIDEYFTELVEFKRKIMNEAIKQKVALGMNRADAEKEVEHWTESSLMKELAHNLILKGRRKWRMA